MLSGPFRPPTSGAEAPAAAARADRGAHGFPIAPRPARNGPSACDPRDGARNADALRSHRPQRPRPDRRPQNPEPFDAGESAHLPLEPGARTPATRHLILCAALASLERSSRSGLRAEPSSTRSPRCRVGDGLPPTDVERVRRACSLESDVVLWVRSMKPRKNLKGLIDAFGGSKPASTLVLVGPRGC